MKKFKLLLIIGAVALLSGCYKFDGQMKISEDGKMDFEIIYGEQKLMSVEDDEVKASYIIDAYSNNEFIKIYDIFNNKYRTYTGLKINRNHKRKFCKFEIANYDKFIVAFEDINNNSYLLCNKFSIIPIIAHKITFEIILPSIRLKSSALVISSAFKNLIIKDNPKPTDIPKIGAPTQPLRAISANPVLAREQFTIKSGTEFPTAKIVIARKDSFTSKGNNNFASSII